MNCRFGGKNVHGIASGFGNSGFGNSGNSCFSSITCILSG